MVTPIRILIAEDVEITRLGLNAMLKRADDLMVVGEAMDGMSAVQLAQLLQPDVVLMDLGLPKMSGMEATRHIRGTCPEVKILIFTTSEDDEAVVAALGAGANAYCVKTMPPAELLEVIRYVAAGAAWLAPSIAAVALKVFTEEIYPAYAGSFNQRHQTDGHQACSTLEKDDPSRARAYNLSERELEVLKLLVAGNSNTNIGKALWISANTAKAHVASIMSKLVVNDRVQAAVKAVREGIIQ